MIGLSPLLTMKHIKQGQIAMSVSLRREALKLYQLATGRRILVRFDELNRTQWLSHDELLALQRDKLQRLLDYAYQYVPHYRRTFDEMGFRPADLRKDPASFQKIPIVTKRYMRDHPDEFLTTDPAVRKTMQTHSTSGSTGEPFTFWEDHNCRDYVTADILRHLTWCGWNLGEPHAYLWGQLMERPLSHRLWVWLMDLSLNRFIVNAYVLSDRNMDALVRRIRRRRPWLLYGYTTALFVFAQFVRERRLDDINFHAVYSAGEVLYPHQRRLIEGTFECKVFNRYATNDVGGIACECEAHTGMHISMENCYVEVLRGDEPVGDDQPGEIVVTNLNNYGFPFIRYRLADIVQKRHSQECPCGRQSPMLESVQGRTVDIFRTADGGAVWGDFEGTVFQVEGIKQSQVIQKAVDLILIRIVRDDTFQDAQLARIERIVKKMMGEATKVQFEFPDHIPMLESGKYYYSYSELSESQPVTHLPSHDKPV
jgi:phenylacetate-CoA ligase